MILKLLSKKMDVWMLFFSRFHTKKQLYKSSTAKNDLYNCFYAVLPHAAFPNKVYKHLPKSP